MIQMKRLLSSILALTLCAAVFCTLPAAAVDTAVTATADVPVRVWGTATWQEDGRLRLQNSDEKDPFHEVVLSVGQDTLVVDAATGTPLTRSVQDGETVYAWVGPTMTLMLPPQTSARLLVANLPTDAAAPDYVQVASVEPQMTAAVYPAPPLTQTEVVTTAGETLRVTADAQLLPWLTRQRVGLSDLIPGARMLVWKTADGMVSRVVLFAYDYQGWVNWTADGVVCVNGQELSARARTVDGTVLLPIRAVAEAAGFTVKWARGRGAVVSMPGDGGVCFSLLPGERVARYMGSEEDQVAHLSAPVVYDNGVTYLAAGDLAALCTLFGSSVQQG